MKKSFPILFWMLAFFLLSSSVNAQRPSIQKVKAADLTYVLNNIRSTYKSQTAGFVVNIFEVSNKSGSAQQNESDEVTDNLYIAISEFDEKPKQLLFVIKDLYAPSNIQLTKQSEQGIQLSFFYLEKREKRRFSAIIKEDGIVID